MLAELEGAEPHRQCQTDAAARALSQTGAIGQRHDDRHQQRNAPHVGRHDKRQRVAYRHHPAHQAEPGTGQVRQEPVGQAIRQAGAADGGAQHETAEHQPECGRRETGKVTAAGASCNTITAAKNSSATKYSGKRALAHSVMTTSVTSAGSAIGSPT